MAKPTIVTIDDDRAVLNAIERDLRQKYGRDYRIIKADSGQSALDSLKQLEQRGDIVALFLTDQRMPQMTGVQFLAEARKIFPEAKKVLLTAYAERFRSPHRTLTGIDLVMDKPFALEVLRDAISKLAPCPKPGVHPV